MKTSKDKVKGKIERRMWQKLRQIALKRAKHRCELCGSEQNLQCDHCYESGTSPQLRFEWENLSVLCSACHTKKSYRINGFEKLVDELVKKRNGTKWWTKAKNMVQYNGFRWDVNSLEDKEKEIDEVAIYFDKREVNPED